MFPVEIWGTVAEWAGALFTGGAAISAATFYILDTRRSQSAQARLVRARFERSGEGSLAFDRVVIANDSDQQISGVYLAAREDSLKDALLKRKTFVIPQILRRTADDEIVHMLNYTADPLSEIRHKSEIVGFDGRAWITVDPQARAIEPGAERQMSLSFNAGAESEYRPSATYWVGFGDAHGISWEREVPDPIGPPVGKLCRVPADDGFGRIAPERRRMLKQLRHRARVWLWLYRHRHESTSSVPPWERTDDVQSSGKPHVP